MTSEGKAVSVHDKLLAQARVSGNDFNLLLTRYSLERFLYRLSLSSYRDALLFSLWYDSPRRPTRDADLLGLESMGMAEIAAIFREICGIHCDDGMDYLSSSLRATEIREDTRYGGIRIDLMGKLGNARCNVQVDVGYGDVVTPEPSMVSFPTILAENPAAVLRAYPKETVIAEKLEAIVRLGMANSRMKDYFDLSVLLGEFMIDDEVLASAINRTFERRQTAFPREVPIGLSEEFSRDKSKTAQWKAFYRKTSLPCLHWR